MPEARKNSPAIAKLMNDIPILVFSNSLKEVNWVNSSLVKGDITKVIKNLKEKADKDIFIFGSGKITNEFLNHGLIDEFRLMINPVLLGEGTSMFSNNKSKFQLLRVKQFRNGNVLLYYKVHHIII